MAVEVPQDYCRGPRSGRIYGDKACTSADGIFHADAVYETFGFDRRYRKAAFAFQEDRSAGSRHSHDDDYSSEIHTDSFGRSG